MLLPANVWPQSPTGLPRRDLRVVLRHSYYTTFQWPARTRRVELRAPMAYVCHVEPVVEHPEGVIVRVRVVPGASRTEVKGRYGDTIKIRVSAAPEGGRANRAVVDLFEDLIDGSAEIIKGSSSRSKTVLIRGVDRSTVVEAIGG